MTVSLDPESKRIIKALTKAIERLSRNVQPFELKPGTTRLSESEPDHNGYVTGEMTEEEVEEAMRKRPEMFASGGYTGRGGHFVPKIGSVCSPPSQVSVQLSAETIARIASSVYREPSN